MKLENEALPKTRSPFWDMMQKNSNSFNHSKKLSASLSIIVVAMGVFFMEPWPFPCFGAQGPVEDPGKPVQTVQQEGANSIEGTEVSRPTRVTTLHVIREDYEGRPLSYPSKVFFDRVKKEIYVTDSGNGRILVYTHDFYPLLAIGKLDGIEAPGGLAVDVDGSLYVVLAPGRKNRLPRIAVFSPSLRWERDIVFAGFKDAEGFQPRNIAIHNRTGRLYVAGSHPGAVVLKKDGSFSHLLSPMDGLKHRNPERATICDVEVGPAGKIFLLSEDMGRVYVYDHDENFLIKFGEKGGSSGKLSRPRGLAIDHNKGVVYVIDYMRHTGNAYSDSGRFLYEFGGKGWGRGWFQFPSDIIVDARGNVLVADTFNNRVQVLKME